MGSRIGLCREFQPPVPGGQLLKILFRSKNQSTRVDQTWRDETACFKSLGLREKCWGELVLGRKDYARHTEMKREGGFGKVFTLVMAKAIYDVQRVNVFCQHFERTLIKILALQCIGTSWYGSTYSVWQQGPHC